MRDIKILAGRILVDPVPVKETTDGGIIKPAMINKKPSSGTVVVRGDDMTDIKMEIREGDKVVFNEGAGNEVEIDEKGYLLMEQRHVLYFTRPQK